MESPFGRDIGQLAPGFARDKVMTDGTSYQHVAAANDTHDGNG
jgi:hypothetical protein